MAKNGVVASGHHLASLAGIEILRQGGNAFDAAIATSAALCVVRPHMTGLGGDAFALCYEASKGKIYALNASGPAPERASRDFFADKGMTRIPVEGIYSVSVPGIVDCWDRISDHSSMNFQELLKPAIQYAADGFPVYRNLSKAIGEEHNKLLRDHTASVLFFRNGRPLVPGEILIQRHLADTLETIAKGARVFYEGNIGGRISDHFRRLGGLLGQSDLSQYSSRWSEPIKTTYRDYTVFEQPPVSQGHILLQELNIVEGFDLVKLGHNSADCIHVMAEAKKLAFADRLRYLGDPEFVKVPLELLLSKKYAAHRRAQIDMKRATKMIAHDRFENLGRDTTYFAIVDGDGNAVSFIQSLFHTFGSGVMVDGTGILLNNRMCAFSLEKNHPNALEPSKKTAHTLNSYIITKNGDLQLVGGTPGADDQVQVNLQVIANILDFQMNVQEAIESPRWSSRPGTMPGEGNGPYELWIEDRIPAEVRRTLAEKGHIVKKAGGWSFGGAQVIVVNQMNKVLMGGADPRRDGYVIGR